jgi:hypothetical protein
MTREAPIDPTRIEWPTARLDPVARMRALASALPHVAIDETVFDVEFDRLWQYVSDLEHSTPQYEAAVSRARVLSRHPETPPVSDDPETDGATPPTGERIELETRAPFGGPWMRFDVVLRPGWCLMRSRFGEVGMAARPEAPGRTRFIHFEGARWLGRLGRPLFAWNIRQDFRKLRARL